MVQLITSNYDKYLHSSKCFAIKTLTYFTFSSNIQLLAVAFTFAKHFLMHKTNKQTIKNKHNVFLQCFLCPVNLSSALFLFQSCLHLGVALRFISFIRAW